MSVRTKTDKGFTFVEALLSIVVLALMASVMTGVYFSGLMTLEVQGNQMLLDSVLRSKMEYLLSQKFDQLANGSETINVKGTDYTLTWTITFVDLDGNLTPETEAKQIALSLEGRMLTTIVVDHEGVIGKL